MQRLKTSAQFQAVLAHKPKARTQHFALHSCALLPSVFPTPGVWVGALTPKRWAKRAVTRNTIRRQIFAAAQAAGLALPEGAHVVRLASGFDPAQFKSACSERLKQAVRAELTQLLRACAAATPALA